MGLAPLSHDMPPSLLYLPGGAIIDYLLHQAELLHPSSIAVLLQYRGDDLHRYLASYPDLTIIPQNPPFTVLSALASTTAWVREPVLVLHGDHYFADSFKFIVEKTDFTHPTFFVDSSESDPFKVCGAYLLPPEAFVVAAEMTEIKTIQTFYKNLKLQGFAPKVVPLPFLAQHIDTADDMMKVNHFLLSRWHDVMHPPRAATGYDALNFNWIAPEAAVDPAFDGLFVTIGPRAVVKASHLYNALILPGTRVEQVNEKNVVIGGTGPTQHLLYAQTQPPHPWRGEKAEP